MGPSPGGTCPPPHRLTAAAGGSAPVGGMARLRGSRFGPTGASGAAPQLGTRADRQLLAPGFAGSITAAGRAHLDISRVGCSASSTEPAAGVHREQHANPVVVTVSASFTCKNRSFFAIW